MRLLLTGLSHKSAPLEVRERFAIPEARLSHAVQRMARYPGLHSAVILSTCNRVEFVAHADSDVELAAFLADYFQLSTDCFRQFFYLRCDKEAVRHVFRVVSSLDSMVVGEAQILGQVKKAYAVARGVNAVDSHLDALFTRAFAVAKRVRSETAVGSATVSVASVAVDLAERIFSSLHGRTVCLVGAGKMCELAARQLLAHGVASIFVANRTYERAEKLAEQFNGCAISFEELYDQVDKADIVITSTGAPTFIFRREHGERFLQRRRNRPMVFIDIAVPRDVDPALNELDGIFLYDIDDLQAVRASNMNDRQEEARRAEALVNEEVDNFVFRLRTAELVPTIVSLQERLETIRQAEIARVRGRLGALSPEQEMAVQAISRGIVNKILHPPIVALKSAARNGEQPNTVIDGVRRLFDLREHSAGGAAVSGKGK